MALEPVSVGLKFGFLAVLYLFLLWVSRSALTRPAPQRRAAPVGRRPGRRAGRTRPACTPPSSRRRQRRRASRG